jgi:hypothetical protein
MFFSRTTGPKQLKFAGKLSCVYKEKCLKNLLKSQLAQRAQIYIRFF